MRNSLFWSFLTCLILLSHLAQAQINPHFRGRVLDANRQAMVGVTLHWADTSYRYVSLSDEEGWFEIQRPDTLQAHILLISALGYEQNQVEILPEEDHLSLTLEGIAALEQVEVTHKQRASFQSQTQAINLEELGSAELRRAACCSLAESFENNATVNVSFSDAITGAREIEMLGLRGTYTQMTLENRPAFNRLARAYGMEYLPGTWLEAIHISKGASTVRNGLQSITGGINAELIKPNKAEPFFLNLFFNHLGRAELNLHLNHQWNQRWSSGLLLHGNYFQREIDHNHDNFLDIPLKQQANALFRQFYTSDVLHAEFNVQGLIDQRRGGQLFNGHAGHLGHQPYLFDASVKRAEFFGKLGYFGFENPSQSLAMIYSAAYHEHLSQIGPRDFRAFQRSLYWNGIFQNSLFNSKKQGLTTGLVYQYDDFIEDFTDFSDNRLEQILGLYSEYEGNFELASGLKASVLGGVRADRVQIGERVYHFLSPRFNLRYPLFAKTILRLSAGRGLRNPNVLMEQLSQMASHRRFERREVLRPEDAWNYGLNLSHEYYWGGLFGQLQLDAYRTDFRNQIIADMYSELGVLRFYNLDGASFANSVLLSWTQDLHKSLELRLAYKFNDLRSVYEGLMEWQPYAPRHRALLALHYTLPKERWDFSFNAQWVGPQRLPLPVGDLSDLPTYRQRGLAPSFALLNGHINYKLKPNFELYLGAENLGNYRQDQPIIDADNPWGLATRFDAASVFAPVMGTMVYAGLRWRLGDAPKAAAACGTKTLQVEQQHQHEAINEADYTRLVIRTSAQCGMCKESIEHDFLHFEGVGKAELNLSSKELIVFYKPNLTSPQVLRAKIAALGYDADELKGDAAVYANLPACCKKPQDR